MFFHFHSFSFIFFLFLFLFLFLFFLKKKKFFIMCLFFFFSSICVRVQQKMFPPKSVLHGDAVSVRHRGGTARVGMGRLLG